MRYRDSPHHEIEKFMCFSYVILLRPNEHKEDHHIKKRIDENLLFELEDKNILKEEKD